MDVHLAEADSDDLTHITADAEKTLCGQDVVELPDFATTYCTDCVDGEFALAMRPPAPIVGILSVPLGE